MIDFGKCDCGGNLIPIYNTWESDGKIIEGIDILRCENCYKDYPAPSDCDRVIRIK